MIYDGWNRIAGYTDGQMIYDEYSNPMAYVDDRFVYGMDGRPIGFTATTTGCTIWQAGIWAMEIKASEGCLVLRFSCCSSDASEGADEDAGFFISL